MDKSLHTIQDWVGNVEGEVVNGEVQQKYQRDKEYDSEFRDSEGKEYDRPSRHKSTDSRVSKVSPGSKESTG